MKAATAIMAAVGLMGCNLDVGPEPSSCELAAQHLASCMGVAQVEMQADCDGTAAAQAESVLQSSCSDLLPADGNRSPMFLNDLMCKVLPFLCNNGGNNNGGNGGNRIFRIGDCWSRPQGFCYDIVKVNPDHGCTELMTRPEWEQPHYTHTQCLQPYGDRCRLARVCQQFQDKGQCIDNVPYHNDQPQCNEHEHEYQPPPPNNPFGGTCNHAGGNNYRQCRDCGWQFCLPNNTWSGDCQPAPQIFPCNGGSCGGDAFCH